MIADVQGRELPRNLAVICLFQKSTVVNCDAGWRRSVMDRDGESNGNISSLTLQTNVRPCYPGKSNLTLSPYR